MTHPVVLKKVWDFPLQQHLVASAVQISAAWRLGAAMNVRVPYRSQKNVVWSPKRTIRHPEQIPNSRDGEWWIPSGKLTWLWKITILNGKTHYKWWFSIAMLNYQRIVALSNLKPSTCWFSQAIHGEDALCVYSVSTSSHQMPFAFLLTCL